MRQIPNGEYCGECPCCHKTIWDAVCNAYTDAEDNPTDLLYIVSYDDERVWKRLPTCLRDKPQVMTLTDRLKLKAEAYRECREEQIREELRSEEAHDEPR